MDAHALTVLEYRAITERLARATATPHGEALALAHEPSPDPDEVTRRQELTAEAIALYDHAAEPSLAGIGDVRDAAGHAEREGVLTPGALHEIAVSIRVALEARRVLESQVDLAPLLGDLIRPIDPALDALAAAVEQAIEEDGSGVRDTASPQLRRLRVQLREGKQRVADQLRRLARSSELSEHLQEDFVTERGGRPVLAVRAGARESVRGIVHDSSSSGQTLFIEPLAVVELNNRLSEAAAAEREEVERILRALSAGVSCAGGRSPAPGRGDRSPRRRPRRARSSPGAGAAPR